jgi:UDP-N-acetylglucosamine 2-epimerase (non-hydrolysing)
MELKAFLEADLSNSVAVVLGTRPEIIKLGPVILALKKSKIPFFVIHTGQHYSHKMDGQFFEDLGLPKPKYLNKHFAKLQRGLSHGEQTAEILLFVESVLLREKPCCVVVEGDTNTVLGAALVARKLGIAVAHVEAGLRSGDWRMPEEHNRVMTDHISDLLFAPTSAASRNLQSEKVRGKVRVVGNTIVDSVLQNRKRAQGRKILGDLGLDPNMNFILCTAHREENVDNFGTIDRFLSVLETVSESFHTPIAFVIHPRTRHRLQHFSQFDRLARIPRIKIVDPVGYLDFLCLLSTCSLALTDSGGVQEEACILKVPCVTLRDNTERPETVTVGANLIAGMDPKAVKKAVSRMLNRRRSWRNPFGDGKSSQRIIAELHKIAQSRISTSEG